MGDGVMVAYSFRLRFVPNIQAGLGLPVKGLVKPKLQTIRAPRKRHARPGEETQLYYAQRTKMCSLIGVVRCVSTPAIAIGFMPNRSGDTVEVEDVGYIAGPLLDRFAQRDGFLDWLELRQFWEDEHTGVDRFEGVLIRWEPLI